MEKRDAYAILTFSLVIFSLYLSTLNLNVQLSSEDNPKACGKDLIIKVEGQATSRIFESQYDLGDTSDYHELVCYRSLATTQAKTDALERSLEDCLERYALVESQCLNTKCVAPCTAKKIAACHESSPPEIKTIKSKYLSGNTYCKMQAVAYTEAELFCGCE